MLRFLTAGESHGPAITSIIEGVPAGIPLSPEDINVDLVRRQTGFGSGGRMRIEKDEVKILSGVMAGHTTGGPISLLIHNKDYKNWKDKEITPMTIPRPGHADLTGAIKYGYDDLRLSLERASARETAMRVAVGAICRKFLQLLGVTIGGYIIQLGEIAIPLSEQDNYIDRFHCAEQSEVRCPIAGYEEHVREEVRRVMKDQDTVGGIWEVVALDVHPGLGSYVHWDRRLDSKIAGAMLSIPAMKGVEIGDAFAGAHRLGSHVHDPIVVNEQGKIGRGSNHAGGLEGGITTGEPLVVRIAMKPIATIVKGMESVDLEERTSAQTVYERSDFCALPRAIPIGEAMLAYILAQEYLEKVGGDSMEEIIPRLEKLRQSSFEDLSMHNQPWKFGFQEF